MTRYLILFVLFLLTESLYAQFEDEEDLETTVVETPVDPAALRQTKDYRTEEITVQKFDQKKWEKIVGNTNYRQERTKKKRKDIQGDSTQAKPGEKGKRYVGDEEDEDDDSANSFAMNFGPVMGLILQIIFYGGIIAIIGLILFHIIKNTSLKSNVKRTKTGLPDINAPVEDIADLDIDALLQQTLAAGNYRLAVRMYFLGLLKKLNEDGFIVWKKDKTNRDYLGELFNKSTYFDEVKKLTLAYEQVWYGDHMLPLESYQKLMVEFRTINQKLNASKSSE